EQPRQPAVRQRGAAVDGAHDVAAVVHERPATDRLPAGPGAALLADARVGVRARLRRRKPAKERAVQPIVGAAGALLQQPPVAVEAADDARPALPVHHLFVQYAVGGPEAIDLAAAQRPSAARFIELGEVRQTFGAPRTQATVRQQRAPFAIVEDLEQEVARPPALVEADRPRRHAAGAQ